MSFHGAKIASCLYSEGDTVITAEDSLNIEPNPIKWYRWTQLTLQGHSTVFVDFSTSQYIDKLKSILKKSHSNTVLYIPTGITDLEDVQDPIRVHQLGSATLSNLRKLLLFLSNIASVKRIILLSALDDGASLIQKFWMSSIERLLLSYHGQFGNSIGLIIVNGVYGPWKLNSRLAHKCWYIDTVAELVRSVSFAESSFVLRNLSTVCEADSNNDGIIETQKWLQDYHHQIKNHKRNVIAGAVLSIANTYHWHGSSAKKNDHEYFMQFVLTALKHEADIVIIHNTITDKFAKNYQSRACQACHFVKYPRANDRIAHDQRMYMFYDYLLKHPDIGNLIITDIKDVVFPGNPFKVMKQIGDYFYTSLDIPLYIAVREMRWLSTMFKKCFPHFKNEEKVLNLYGIFNSGVMGGSRHAMLSLLSRMILLLDTANLNAVCDMTSAQAVYHLDYYDHIYAGYPFTGSLMIGIPGPQGAAIKHKPFESFNETELDRV